MLLRINKQLSKIIMKNTWSLYADLIGILYYITK